MGKDDSKKRKKILIKRGIKRALQLPGAEIHINRKKRYWKQPDPSDDILESWLRFYVIDMISRKLNRESLIDLVSLYELFHKRHPDF